MSDTMADQNKVDELIKMLDASMASGTGHINVKVSEDENITLEEVTVKKGEMCDFGDTACKIPNLPMEDD